MRPGEIYLANFPFGDTPGMKLRPVLVLTKQMGAAAEVLVAYISSVIPPRPMPSDMFVDPRLQAYAATNLKTSSVIRLHKLATIHTTSLARRLGHLDTETLEEARSRLRNLLEL